jgi:ribokinase
MFEKKFAKICFGSATQDIVIKSKAFKVDGQNVCLVAGTKVDVDDLEFVSGGGGTNVAATFVKQGLRTAYCGSIGNDAAGRGIIDELKDMGVDVDMVVAKKKKNAQTVR